MSAIVYLVQAGNNGLVKIGWTADLSRRLSNLTSASGLPIKVLATVAGGRSLEAHLHEKFGEHRERGEWFRAHPEIIHFARRLNRLGTGILPAGLFDPDVNRLSFSPSDEAAVLLREIAEPRLENDSVRAAIDRAARRVSVHMSRPMSFGRAEDIWRREARRIDAFEVDAIRAAHRARVVEPRSIIERLEILAAQIDLAADLAESDEQAAIEIVKRSAREGAALGCSASASSC